MEFSAKPAPDAALCYRMTVSTLLGAVATGLLHSAENAATPMGGNNWNSGNYTGGARGFLSWPQRINQPNIIRRDEMETTTCTHPPTRLYSGLAYNCITGKKIGSGLAVQIVARY
jgi:hypothetical protein